MSLTNSPSWMYNPSTGFYNGVATQSLRFDDASSAYLSRTPSSAANRRTFTISCWVKRSNLGLQGIFEANHSKDNDTALLFENSHQLLFTDRPNDNRNIDIRTNRLFRDVGAWYHIVVRVDTTQGTASNRVRLYINGEQETSFATSSYPSQNYDVAFWNNTNSHRIGYMTGNVGNYYDGYIAEFNNVGSSQAPTAFGETKNDIWIPKAYSGSYGTNGFRLEFNGNGNDSSGNGNNFTTSNISSHDYVSDCPENNFATLNPLDRYNSPTLSEGSLKLVRSSNYGVSTGTIAVNSGKWYWEIRCPTVTTSGENESFGISKVSSNIIGNAYLGVNTNSWALMIDNAASDIYFMHNNSFTDSGINASNGDIFMFALDADTGKLWFGRNGTWFDSGNPSAGTNQKYTASTDDVYYVVVSMNGNEALILNFGQDSTFAGGTTAGGNSDGNGKGDFKYTVPSGFLALCSANLPVAIDNNEDESAQDYFNTVTYTGTGSTQSRTGVGFQPDFLWIKQRNTSRSHRLLNSSMFSYYLASDNTNNQSPNDVVNSLDSDGFTLLSPSSVNQSGGTYVAWNWKANGGTTSSNTNGSITSTVQANQEAGFSIVTYTGNGSSGATIGHGLSQAPDLIITKFRTGGSPGSGWLWPVFHKGVGTGGYLRLNDNDATTSNSQTVKAVGSSTYTIGSDGHINQSSGNFVAFVFHEVDGYSKFGSYTGNASSDGTFIYTGFRPSFLLYKRTNGSNSWAMLDTKREPNNVLGDNNIFPNTNAAEAGNSAYYVDFLSNGFKLRTGDDQINSGNYIYIAFADQPFKYANAR